MNDPEKRRWFSRLLGGFFNKRVLPYWCILLLDAFIVFASCVFCYWVENRSVVLIHQRDSVFVTSVFYAMLSWIGARIFRTYAGVVRYSSLVDLMKVAFANLVSLALALVSYWILQWQNVPMFSALSPIAIVASFIVATMLMWAMRRR